MTTPNERTAEKLFGADGVQLLDAARVLVDDFEQHPIRYSYMDPQAFEQLSWKDSSAGQKIYWEEMLRRAHFAAAASVIRAYRWCGGMMMGYSQGLFLPFCASFRALIESAADGYDVLRHVAVTLAECRNTVNPIIQLKSDVRFSNVLLIAKELEDSLIHFSHARKLTKGEVAPESHKAKTAAEYVKSLEQQSVPGLYDCYSELCQFTHPAAHSVGHLLVPESQTDFVLVPAHDEKRIEHLIKARQKLVVPLFMSAFNPGALALKVLLHFDVPQLHTPAIRRMNLRGLPGWRKYAAKMDVEP
ncbi:hypothetical protein [Hyalangium versicolor]|uniref:hypothetical protein n=1 Tax=Hyalangium versicolor TaxID=2861190 RepID=UPI001CCD4D51|nr:hypothetical protein [Hyalangium versicolor]